MKNFFLYDAKGCITQSGMCPDDVFNAQAQPGLAVAEGVADPATQYFDGTNAVTMPPKPAPQCVFDYTARSWVDPSTLQDAVARKMKDLRAASLTAERAGFVYAGSTFDSDLSSQIRISLNTILATRKLADFPMDWPRSDGSVVSLAAQDMLDLGAALAEHLDAVQAKARGLYAQVQAATTVQAVQAIVWA